VVNGQERKVSDFEGIRAKLRPLATCPQCERHVTLKLGDKVVHHAAHRPGDLCSATRPETALHLITKFHLAAELRRTVSARGTVMVSRSSSGEEAGPGAPAARPAA
jgi:competence CoiA-like predicted nuclease